MVLVLVLVLVWSSSLLSFVYDINLMVRDGIFWVLPPSEVLALCITRLCLAFLSVGGSCIWQTLIAKRVSPAFLYVTCPYNLIII